MDQTRPPGIRIHQIFLEGASFAHRADFLALEPTTPVNDIPTEIELQFARDVDKERRGALRLTLRTTTDDALYRFSISVGAVVEQDSGANMQLRDYVEASAVALLVPYLREALSNLTGRGRFGPIWLQPMNVRAMLTPADAEQQRAAPEKSKAQR